MNIDSTLRNDLLLKELGARLAQRRVIANISQDDFAKKSGIALSSLQRLEHGDPGTRLLTFLAALRALDGLEGLEFLLPEPALSPMALASGAPAKVPRHAYPRKEKNAVRTWGNGMKIA